MHTTVVFAGGPPPDADRLDRLRGRLAALPYAGAVAADAGLHLAQDLGVPVGLVVGDMDSVDPERLAAAEAEGVDVRRHPADKDETDLELALAAVLEGGAGRVVVVGSPAGRLDHLLALMTVLAAPRWASLAPEAWLGDDRVLVVDGERELRGDPGAVVTLLPLNGRAVGVRTHGLRWPLDGEVLEAGTGRGVSNELLDHVAKVQLDEGVLLAVLPGSPS